MKKEESIAAVNDSANYAKYRSKRIKGRKSTRFATALIYVVCGVIGISMLAPFLYIVAGSFATEKELTERAFFIIPHDPSLGAFKYIIKQGTIFLGLWNSIEVTVIGTIYCMIMTTLCAYPLSKRHLRGRNFFMNIIIITMLFGGGMIPSYLVVKGLGMLDTMLALIIPSGISAFNMVIVKNFFQELPIELEEASEMDGATDFDIFFKICLPLSKPVIASISLFYAVNFWNSYFGPMIYLNSSDKYTVQLILRQIMTLAQAIQTDVIDVGSAVPPDKAVRMACTVVATVPILIIYPFLQKHFAKGVMVGSVKGCP